MIGTQFEGSTIDPNFWTSVTSNSATIVQGENDVVLSSGTNSVGSAQFHTVRRGRVIAGISNGYRSVTQLGDTGIANNKRRWGLAWGSTMPTITDGAYFQLNGTTFSIVTNKGSTETVVNSGNFNGSVTSYAMTTNAATYEILYTQVAVMFIINDVLIYTVDASAATWGNSINLHIYMSNVNSGNTTDVSLACRTASVRRFGKENTSPSHRRISTATTTICKYGPGYIHNVVVNNPTNNLITIYNNTAGSGDVMAVINPGNVQQPFTLFYDMSFDIGLTIVTGGTADITVIYE